MVRTQIQLTESQADRAKRLAERWHTSMAEVIRRSLDRTLATEDVPARDEIRRRAAAAVGAFASGGGDLSETHDEYLAEVGFR